jgi:hypothetical protein
MAPLAPGRADAAQAAEGVRTAPQRRQDLRGLQGRALNGAYRRFPAQAAARPAALGHHLAADTALAGRRRARGHRRRLAAALVPGH